MSDTQEQEDNIHPEAETVEVPPENPPSETSIGKEEQRTEEREPEEQKDKEPEEQEEKPEEKEQNEPSVEDDEKPSSLQNEETQPSPSREASGESGYSHERGPVLDETLPMDSKFLPAQPESIQGSQPSAFEEYNLDYGEMYDFKGEFYYPQEEGDEYLPMEGETEEESSTSSLSQVYSKLSPYFIKWAFGVKTDTKMINLTKDNQFEIFYAASHFGVIYDYRRNSMRFLPGHNSKISSIAADASGRWLITADEGEDNAIIIWDHERRVPCWALYNIFSGQGTQCVQISHDARFLAVVSKGEKQLCKFYLWTFGRDEADADVELFREYGVAKHIQFNHLDTSQFAITMDDSVVLCQWIPEKKIIDSYITVIKKVTNKNRVFIQTLYLDDNHTVITSTSTGHIVVWCDVIYIDQDVKEQPGSIQKKHLKTIRIHRSCITSLQLSDQVIVSSSEEGVISFHDQTLSLLYWVPRYIFESVICVSCNLQQQQGDQLDPFSNEFDDLLSSKRSSSEENIQDLIADDRWTDYTNEDDSARSEDEKNPDKTLKFSVDEENKSARDVPSDCTIEMRPFYMRDFIFLTNTGRFGYVSHHRVKVRYFLHVSDETVLSMDCNPNKPHLVTGNSVGRIDLYEHRLKKLLVSNVIANVAVTTLKFSPTGRYLMAGLTNGSVMVVNPLLLSVVSKVQIGKAEVIKMCFSSNEVLFSFYDKSNAVYLFEKNKKKKWIFMGGYHSHYKNITDVIFDENYDQGEKKIPRMFTIGEDRMLVEYDTGDLEPGVLKLKSIDRIEQTSVPQCIEILPREDENVYFLISNNDYKLKVFERNTRICAKTTLGPTADSPINFMKILPQSSSEQTKMMYTTEKHIGLKLLPPTGNPFEGMGMVGHPNRITSIAISHDGKYIFTTGLDDTAILMWKINYKSVDISYQLGGSGIEPFMSLIEGGPKGFLFKEVQDFFYYSQIIHQGEHANIDRTVSKTLALCELPDMVRSLGYYPTDYEITNMMYEVRHTDYKRTGELKNEISFEECVIIYLNHRPFNGISLDSINKALLTIADLSDPECIIIERDELYKALEERAEAMSHAEVVGYLCILLLPKDEKNPIPGTMTLQDFADDVLGIDLSITEENVREITHPFDIDKNNAG